MKIDNPFDKKLDIWKGHMPNEVVDAATFVNDTLDLCMASAQNLFGEKASSELALEIYDRVIEQIELRSINNHE